MKITNRRKIYVKDDTYMIFDDGSCSECARQLNKKLQIFYVWKKSGNHEQHFLCEECSAKKADEFSKLGDVVENFWAGTVDEIPEGARIVALAPPPMRASMTAFEATTIPTEHTEDHTRFAGTETWNGAQIGKPDWELLEKKDKPLEIEEGPDYLDKLARATPTIEAEKKKELTHDEGKKQ